LITPEQNRNNLEKVCQIQVNVQKFRLRFLECYVWSQQLYEVETWMLRLQSIRRLDWRHLTYGSTDTYNSLKW